MRQGPSIQAYVRQSRELASSGRSAEVLCADVADMTMELPDLDQPIRLGDVRGKAISGSLRSV